MAINKTIIKVFLGCCASSFLMEILMVKAAQTANLITFLQSLTITIQGFIFTMKFGTIKPKIPIKEYALLVTLFFVTNVANNYVYVLHVPSTLHMIIRSASSPASMILYWLARSRKPRLNNAIGSLLISAGVALAMYGGASIVNERTTQYFYWCIGVAILLTTLVTGAFTGLQQENLFTKYGKHPNEMLFFINAIPLPLFLGIYPQLRDTGASLSANVWFLIIINIISQFYCASSVHELAAKENSVTVSFILTVRKFLSLLISSVVFKNNLTYFHVLGTVLVTLGTFIYFDFFSRRKQKAVSLKDD